MADHEVQEVLHCLFCLHVQVTQHLVQAAASENFNDVAVDAGTEEVHGDCSPEGAGGDVTGFEYEGRPK